MIDAIYYRNLKGQTCAQQLTGRDIFIGPNGSGKTSRIQALGLSMLGYVPGNGKTEAETFKLATGQVMSVGLHTSDQFGFERQFVKNEDYNRKTGERTVKITQSIQVFPGRGEANDTQRKARIAEEVGSFPVMLDFNEFLALSDAKRRAFWYGLSPIMASEWSKDRIREYLAEHLLTPELQQNNPEHYQVMQELIAEAMAQFPAGYSVSDGLQAMIDWVTPKLKTEKGKKQDAQGAVRQLAELKNKLEETDRNIEAERAELEKLRQKLVEVEKQISRDTEKKRIFDERNRRIEELRNIIARLEAPEKPAQEESAPAQEETVSLADLDKQLADLRAQLVTVDSSAVDTLEARQTEIAAAVEPLNKRREELAGKLTQNRAGLATLEESLKTINGLNGVCVIDKRIGCDKDFTKYRAWVEKKRVEASAEIARLQTELNGAIKELNALLDEERQNKETIRQLLEEGKNANKRNSELNEQIAELERKRNEILTADDRRQGQIKLHRDELTRLMNEPADPIAPLDILEKQAEGFRTRIEVLTASVEEKTKARQTLVLMQQSMLENKTAELKAACLKSISESLGPKGIQGELVKEVLGPIKDDIQANLRTMGFDREPFFETESDTGKEIFQFGWINEKGHRVNFDALSAGEQTIFLAAMMTTIISRANPKLKLLVIDNLNHLDRQNLQLALNGLGRISGLDNIVLAGAIEFPFEADGWKVWLLRPEKEASEVA